jgi:hypothetical protein
LKDSAAAGGIYHAKAPIVRLDNATADSQPEACSSRLGAEKRFEDSGRNLWSNAYAVIFHLD